MDDLGVPLFLETPICKYTLWIHSDRMFLQQFFTQRHQKRFIPKQPEVSAQQQEQQHLNKRPLGTGVPSQTKTTWNFVVPWIITQLQQNLSKDCTLRSYLHVQRSFNRHSRENGPVVEQGFAMLLLGAICFSSITKASALIYLTNMRLTSISKSLTSLKRMLPLSWLLTYLFSMSCSVDVFWYSISIYIYW